MISLGPKTRHAQEWSHLALGSIAGQSRESYPQTGFWTDDGQTRSYHRQVVQRNNLPPQSNSLGQFRPYFAQLATTVCLTGDQDPFRQAAPLSPELHRRPFHPSLDRV
jgi:hypothetical protein